MSCFMSTKCEGALQGTATTSGDIAHDLSKANALSNALAVMCGEPSPNRALLFTNKSFSSLVLDQEGVQKRVARGILCHFCGLMNTGCFAWQSEMHLMCHWCDIAFPGATASIATP